MKKHVTIVRNTNTNEVKAFTNLLKASVYLNETYDSIYYKIKNGIEEVGEYEIKRVELE